MWEIKSSPQIMCSRGGCELIICFHPQKDQELHLGRVKKMMMKSLTSSQLKKSGLTFQDRIYLYHVNVYRQMQWFSFCSMNMKIAENDCLLCTCFSPPKLQPIFFLFGQFGAPDFLHVHF